MMIASYQQKPKAILAASIVLVAVYSVGVFELGRELGHEELGEQYRRQLRVERKMIDCGGHPKKLYGHIHIGKTGGTNLNGILANKFERVCGHKGYSYDAYHNNELLVGKEGKTDNPLWGAKGVHPATMDEIGYDDCDYVSHEVEIGWWIDQFAENKFHNLDVELHLPCREPIDHLMSQCNHRHTKLKCDAEIDEDYFKSIEQCLTRNTRERYSRELEEQFEVKCFDFKQSFTSYIDYMDKILETRRIEPEHYVMRDSNKPRHKESECISDKPDLMEKTKKYLLEHVDYYAFCDKCIGSENEIPQDGIAATAD